MTAPPAGGAAAEYGTFDFHGLPLHRIDRNEVCRRVREGVAAGRGGWVLTPNVELVQQASRDAEVRALYGRADLRVPDGSPLLWMARLAGHPFPERVAGSDLVWLLAEQAAHAGHRLFLLGGDDGVASEAARKLTSHYPGLVVAGHFAPRVSTPPTGEELAAIAEALAPAQPDLVFVAFGSPKTEYLIDALRARFPRTWWMGCGISLSFVAGEVQRAPRWVQRIGLEWAHRLLQEPGRLAGRYLRNVPFALSGLTKALRGRHGPPSLS